MITVMYIFVCWIIVLWAFVRIGQHLHKIDKDMRKMMDKDVKHK